MKQLREYIRQILIEAMVKPSSISQSMALAYDSVGDKKFFVLFDPIKARKSIERYVANLKSYIDVGAIDGDLEAHIDPRLIEGAIGRTTVAVMEAIDEGEGVWSGSRTAADKGYGPTMYELMMMASPRGFISDSKGMSSSHTWSVWKKFLQRDDVKKEPFERNFEPGQGHENQIFSMSDDGSIASLKTNYETFLNGLSEINPSFSRISSKNIMVGSLVGNFFGERYEEAGYFGGGEDR